MRTLSYVVAYMILVTAVLVSDAILLTVFGTWIRGERSVFEGLINVVARNGVEGLWVPTLLGTEPRIEITLLNDNPLPVEVVLLAQYGNGSGTYFVELTDYGIRWLSEPVKIVEPRWFKDARTAFVIPPRRSVSFSVPAIYGYPAKIYACTRTGCVELHTVGVRSEIAVKPYPWIIEIGRNEDSNNKNPVPVFAPRSFYWFSEVVAGPVHSCVLWKTSPHVPIGTCGTTVECCLAKLRCPSTNSILKVCVPDTRRVLQPRGTCRTTDGVIQNMWSSATVRNVAFLYLSTDPSFSFVVPPKTITVGTHEIDIAGVSVSGASPVSIPTSWNHYDFVECNENEVTIHIVYRPVIGGKEYRTFAEANLSQVLVYVAARGYVSYVPYEIDSVTIVVYTPRAIVGKLVADSNTVRDAWWIVPGDVSRIDIAVTYHMIGPAPSKPAKDSCYTVIGCGDAVHRRNVRLAFYVQVFGIRS